MTAGGRWLAHAVKELYAFNLLHAEGVLALGRKASSSPQLSRRARGWLRALGVVALLVGAGHLMVLVLRSIFGKGQPRELDPSDFALWWTVMALGAVLYQWWERRSRKSHPKSADSHLQDSAPRRIDAAATIVLACAQATWFAVYLGAIFGELGIFWADAFAAFAYTIAAIVSRARQRQVRSRFP